MKSFLAVILCALTLRAQELPNPLALPDGRIVWNPSRELCLQYGEIVTNTTEAGVVTNYPANYAAKRAAVSNYLALVTEAGVLGLGEDGADAKLDADFKAGTQAQKNDALRVSLKLLRAKLQLERLGIDPLSASASITPVVVTNAAATNITYRQRN